MPKQIWIHKKKRTFVIRHSNADVIMDSYEPEPDDKFEDKFEDE